MQHNTAIGIMDEAYFVPRQQILLWIQKCLKLHVNVIEDLGTGAVYCQLLDAAFSQRVPMQKVNWNAKFQYEFISNLKIFQTVLEKLGISKKIDIEKLAKAKYQDNLELIQWLKRYIQISGNIDQDYKAEQKRSFCQLYPVTQSKKALGASFKSNTSFLNSSNINLNQSICSTVPSSTKKMVKTRQVSNKQNNFSQNIKKQSANSKPSTDQLNEIKKILLSQEDSDSKIADINKIVFGFSKENVTKENLMHVEVAEEEDEEMVF